MQRITPRQRSVWLFELAEHTGKHWRDVERIGSLLLRYGATYKRYQEMWCSVQMSDEEVKRLEKRERALEVRIAGLCAELGLSTPNGGVGVMFGGDPRGYTVKLQLLDGYTNDWGKTGFGVPTS